jgi:hypothetical protein
VFLFGVESQGDHGNRKVHFDHEIGFSNQERNGVVKIYFDALLLGTHRQEVAF